MRLFSWLFQRKTTGIRDPSASSGAAETSVVVRGPWMSALWSDVPVTLPRAPNIPELLLQSPTPPLIQEARYIASNSADADRALHWVIALLHHPDSQVVLATFRFWSEYWARFVDSEVKMSYRTLMFDSAADHLTSDQKELAREAAQFAWRGYSQANFKSLMSILEDPQFPNKRKAIGVLRLHCPQQHLSAFQSLVG